MPAIVVSVHPRELLNCQGKLVKPAIKGAQKADIEAAAGREMQPVVAADRELSIVLEAPVGPALLVYELPSMVNHCRITRH